MSAPPSVSTQQTSEPQVKIKFDPANRDVVELSLPLSVLTGNQLSSILSAVSSQIPPVSAGPVAPQRPYSAHPNLGSQVPFPSQLSAQGTHQSFQGPCTHRSSQGSTASFHSASGPPNVQTSPFPAWRPDPSGSHQFQSNARRVEPNSLPVFSSPPKSLCEVIPDPNGFNSEIFEDAPTADEGASLRDDANGRAEAGCEPKVSAPRLINRTRLRQLEKNTQALDAQLPASMRQAVTPSIARRFASIEMWKNDAAEALEEEQAHPSSETVEDVPTTKIAPRAHVSAKLRRMAERATRSSDLSVISSGVDYDVTRITVPPQSYATSWQDHGKSKKEQRPFRKARNRTSLAGASEMSHASDSGARLQVGDEAVQRRSTSPSDEYAHLEAYESKVSSEDLKNDAAIRDAIRKRSAGSVAKGGLGTEKTSLNKTDAGLQEADGLGVEDSIVLTGCSVPPSSSKRQIKAIRTRSNAASREGGQSAKPGRRKVVKRSKRGRRIRGKVQERKSINLPVSHEDPPKSKNGGDEQKSGASSKAATPQGDETSRDTKIAPRRRGPLVAEKSEDGASARKMGESADSLQPSSEKKRPASGEVAERQKQPEESSPCSPVHGGRKQSSHRMSSADFSRRSASRSRLESFDENLVMERALPLHFKRNNSRENSYPSIPAFGMDYNSERATSAQDLVDRKDEGSRSSGDLLSRVSNATYLEEKKAVEEAWAGVEYQLQGSYATSVAVKGPSRAAMLLRPLVHQGTLKQMFCLGLKGQKGEMQNIRRKIRGPFLQTKLSGSVEKIIEEVSRIARNEGFEVWRKNGESKLRCKLNGNTHVMWMSIEVEGVTGGSMVRVRRARADKSRTDWWKYARFHRDMIAKFEEEGIYLP